MRPSRRSRSACWSACRRSRSRRRRWQARRSSDPHGGPRQRCAHRGLKVIAEHGWFAARPSGTEEVYKIYAESFKGADHLQHILEEAQVLIGKALRGRAGPALRG